MTARWWAFGLWFAVAASGVYWGLKLFVSGRPVPAQTQLATITASPRGDLTRLLGADPVAEEPDEPAPNARFQLIGVVAPRGAGGEGEGLALIAVDGKPPRAYRVGAVIDGDLVLKTVGLRTAALGPRGSAASVSLDIPPPAPAATGSFPTAGAAVLPPSLRPQGSVPRPLSGAPPPGMVRLPQPPQPQQQPAAGPTSVHNSDAIQTE